jgi:hypothetical protein
MQQLSACESAVFWCQLITGVEIMSAVLYLFMYRCSAAVGVTFCFIYLLESITELDAVSLIPSIKTPLMTLPTIDQGGGQFMCAHNIAKSDN